MMKGLLLAFTDVDILYELEEMECILTFDQFEKFNFFSYFVSGLSECPELSGYLFILPRKMG